MHIHFQTMRNKSVQKSKTVQNSDILSFPVKRKKPSRTQNSETNFSSDEETKKLLCLNWMVSLSSKMVRCMAGLGCMTKLSLFNATIWSVVCLVYMTSQNLLRGEQPNQNYHDFDIFNNFLPVFFLFMYIIHIIISHYFLNKKILHFVKPELCRNSFICNISKFKYSLNQVIIGFVHTMYIQNFDCIR